MACNGRYCGFGAGPRGSREDSLCGLRYSSVHHREVGVSRSNLGGAQAQVTHLRSRWYSRCLAFWGRFFMVKHQYLDNTEILCNISVKSTGRISTQQPRSPAMPGNGPRQLPAMTGNEGQCAGNVPAMGCHITGHSLGTTSPVMFRQLGALPAIAGMSR